MTTQKKKKTVERPSVDGTLEEFTNERVGVRFTIPKRISVRDQMTYRGRIWGFALEDVFIRHWFGAVDLIVDWTSTEWDENGFLPFEPLPVPSDLDLDEADSTIIANAIHWAGNEVAGHITSLGELKKT